MKKVGRPTNYGPHIITKTREYIDQCEDTEEEVLTGLSAKGTELYKQKLNVNIPTIEGLALYLDIARDTIYEWEKEEDKKEFSDILAKLRAKQANALINNGLSGNYNPTIAKVLLVKHGYRDGHELTGKDGKDLKVNFDPIFDNKE